MILVTGNLGYLGSMMADFLKRHSYEVVGLDSNYYNYCNFYDSGSYPKRQIIKDIRDVEESDLQEVQAIIHLAGLSNDPLGEVNPLLTYEINCMASVKLAKLAKKLKIEKFIFSSSCSSYGIAAEDEFLTEEDKLSPVTAYAKAKVDAEREISKLADENFHPVFMRNSTIYGVSPFLRLDLVVNNLVAWAYLVGKVAIMSDGAPWRPIIHVEDVCRAFVAALEASSELIHNKAFNIGINEENYQIKDIAWNVKEIVPNCSIEILNKTGSDERTYRVDFSKARRFLPDFKPVWDVCKGIESLYKAYKDFKLEKADLESAKYFRVRWIKYLMKNGKINNELRCK